MIRTIIVDDEPLARDGIRMLLQKDAEIKIIAECNSGTRAVNVLNREGVDLVFLDVQMPGMSGFDVLSQIPVERMPVVIFVTAYDHYAMQAFKVHALDYLLKPFSDKEFLHALGHAKTFLRLQSMSTFAGRIGNFLREFEEFSSSSSRVKPLPSKANMRQSEFITRLGVPSNGRIVLLQIGEIDWIEAADYCVNLHVSNKSYSLRETLSNLEARLDPLMFVRIHRSTIVRLDSVREIEPFFRGESVAVLHNGTKLKVGRTYRHKLKKFTHHTL